MKKIGFIPVRLNSKRVPGKSVKLMDGVPLLHYNLRTMLSLGLDAVYVYCSSPEIQDYLLPGTTWLPRSVDLDRDETRGLEVWTAFEAATSGADIVVMSHATAPFIKATSISRGIAKLVEEGFTSSCSVRSIKTYCWFQGRPLNFARGQIVQTQLLEPVYEETGGFYIWRHGVVTTEHTRLSKNHAFVPIEEVESVDVDYPEDFDLAEIIARGIRAGS